MNWWKKFWRLRKQEDRVKIVFLLFLLGIACLVYGIYNSVRLHQAMHTSVEYMLTGEGNGSPLERKQKELREWENLAGISICRKSGVRITYRGQETAFSCMELSADYIEKIYGLAQSGVTKTFYMNQKAFDMVKEAEGDAVAGMFGNADSLRVTYEIEDTEEGQAKQAEHEGKEKKTAVIVLVKEGVREEEPFVFSAAENGILEKYGTEIRICSKGQDMDGSQVRKLQEMGLTVENMQMYQELEYFRNVKEIRIKYNLGMAALCLFCACMLWRAGKET